MHFFYKKMPPHLAKTFGVTYVLYKNNLKFDSTLNFIFVNLFI